MKNFRFIITTTCALLASSAWAQYNSLVVRTIDGQAQSFSIATIDSITFETTQNVQRDKWYHMIENPGVADFLRDFEYDPNDYSYTMLHKYVGEPYLDKYQDWPYGVVLGDKTYFNLVPGLTYKIDYTENGKTNKIRVNTVGQLRMIKCEGIDNVRDLGGWPTESGKKIKYGLLFRGTELTTCTAEKHLTRSRHTATEADKKILREDLKIKAELDLRAPNETMGNSSPLGSSIEYKNYAIDQKIPTDKGNRELIVKCFRFILSHIRKGEAVYFHCVMGADRTGMLAMLMEGVLGVNQSNLDKDFELTSFSGNTRNRFDESITKTRNDVRSCQGNKLQDKFYNWWLQAGATKEELDEFKQIMLVD